MKTPTPPTSTSLSRITSGGSAPSPSSIRAWQNCNPSILPAHRSLLRRPSFLVSRGIPPLLAARRRGSRDDFCPRHGEKTRSPCGFPRPGAPEAAFFKGFLRFSLALTCPLRYSVRGAAPERVSGKLARRWHPLPTRRHNLDVKADEQVEDRGAHC